MTENLQNIMRNFRIELNSGGIDQNYINEKIENYHSV